MDITEWKFNLINFTSNTATIYVCYMLLSLLPSGICLHAHNHIAAWSHNGHHQKQSQDYIGILQNRLCCRQMGLIILRSSHRRCWHTENNDYLEGSLQLQKRKTHVRIVNLNTTMGSHMTGKLIRSLTAIRFASPRLNLNAGILTGQSIGLNTLTESLFVAIHSTDIKHTVRHVGGRRNYAMAGFERPPGVTHDATGVFSFERGNFVFITNWTLSSTAPTVMARHIYHPWLPKSINVRCYCVIGKSEVIVFVFVVVAAKTTDLVLVWRRHYDLNIINSVIQHF